MTFVVTDDNRDRLNDFTQLLLATFPGSILYMYTDPMEVIGCLRDHPVDVVFIEAAMEEMEGAQLLFELRERHYELPAFILADSDEYEDDAMWNDATGYLIRPISAEKLRDAVQSALKQSGYRPGNVCGAGESPHLH